MGNFRRRKPEKLPTKLRAIRMSLDLTQSELAEKLHEDQFPVYKADISNFESGKREPNLIALLRYARLGQVSLETLADDELELR